MPKSKDARATVGIVERAIAAVAPGWAEQRSASRLRVERNWAAEAIVRNYDAAAFSARTKGWLPSQGSANAVIGMGLDRLRARCRDLACNNEWAVKGLGVIEDDVVGSGFGVKFDHPTDKGLAEEAKKRWEAWADELLIDTSGLQDVSGLLGAGVHGMAEGGEMIYRRRWRRAEDGLPIPLQVQLIEGEHLDSTKDEVGNDGSRKIQGVEYDAIGRRVAYWLFREHPGDAMVRERDSVRVPATEVLHLFREDRRGAVRGVPWLAPCAMRLREAHEMEDAKLLRHKLANHFVAAVKMATSIKEFSPGVDAEGKPWVPLESFKPGTFQYLNPGEEIEWNTPPTPGEDHDSYMGVTLRAVAAGLQIPYEAMTGDLRKTSFSSGRLGWLQWNRRVEAYRWRIVVPRVCKPLGRWFLEALAIEDSRFLGVTMTWDPPHREMIDPTQEVAAFVKEIRAGLRSRQDAIRSLGRDPAQVVKERKADAEADKAAGIIADSDPMNDLGRKPDAPGRKAGEAANAPK